MFTIAVCDDDMQERMQEVQIVKNIFSQKELEAGIEEFQTGQHFLDVLHRVPYDIVLLDIQMGEVSGFTLAEELYKITGGENIIFVSSMENLVFESIHFRPFRFVRKSHLEEELTEAVESWIQQNTKRNVWSLMKPEGLRRFYHSRKSSTSKYKAIICMSTHRKKY